MIQGEAPHDVHQYSKAQEKTKTKQKKRMSIVR